MRVTLRLVEVYNNHHITGFMSKVKLQGKKTTKMQPTLVCLQVHDCKMDKIMRFGHEAQNQT